VRKAQAVLAVLAGLALLTGCAGNAGNTGQAAGSSSELRGAVLDTPYVVPPAPLTDTAGEAYSLTRDTDKPLTLVFFGYTHCPDICQVVMSTVASALTRLDDADRERVDVAFVTTDPARDTGPVLREYLDNFDAEFIGLTGELDTIVDLGKPMAVAVEQGKKLPSGGYEVTHSTHVSGIGSDDQVSIVWTQGTSSADFASDIHQLLQK
jgi:protein SCO1